MISIPFCRTGVATPAIAGYDTGANGRQTIPSPFWSCGGIAGFAARHFPAGKILEYFSIENRPSPILWIFSPDQLIIWGKPLLPGIRELQQ